MVDVDLERFFDRVCHDVLMERLSRRVSDRRVLRLIRRYLEAGVMVNGVATQRQEGTPQGGPLSPLLANVLLDEVDKELERGGHSFRALRRRLQRVCAVTARGRSRDESASAALCGTPPPGQRVEERGGEGDAAHLSRLRLLGGVGKSGAAPGVTESPLSDEERVRQVTRRTLARSLTQMCADLRSYLGGWKEYFRLAETPRVFSDLDEWIRHRLRAVHVQH